MVKAVFFDIDGTLVSFKTHRIPRSAAEALGRLRAKGVKLFIATGRHPLGVDNLGGEHFDGYLYMNGGLCRLGDEIVFRNPIDSSCVDRLIDALPSTDIACVFSAEDAWYLNRVNDRVRAMNALIDVRIPLIDVGRLRGVPIYQITPYLPRDEAWRVMQYMSSVKQTRWCEPIFDINPEIGGKGYALREVAGCLGIDISQTMAFGDGGNDVDMIRAAGWGVAMGNATDELKAAADYVTSPVDEAGVARAVEHFERLGVL